MLTKKDFDRPYPERAECEVNDQNCHFGVDSVCHECGKLLCMACSIGIRHQPQLVKYRYREGGTTERIQQHCPQCLDGHSANERFLAAGLAAILLAIIFTWGSGGDSLWMILVATILLIIGIGALWNEYWLKKRHNSRYSITSILR